MGAALNTAGAAELATEIACCACSSAFSFLLKDQATRAKVRYLGLIILCSVTSFVITIPGMRLHLNRIPYFCGKLITKSTCDKLVGFSAVYRTLITLVIFYLILAILNLRVTKVTSIRARFNNGFWIFKFLLFLLILIATFYIPNRTHFFRIWMYFSLSGGFMFVLYQILVVIDFGHSWSVSWAERLEAGYPKLWYTAMLIATGLMFSISVLAAACFYLFFSHPFSSTKCRANTVYITFISAQSILAIIVSVTPSIQQGMSGAGLLQSCVVVLYTMYLTWNTLSAEPDATCNPLGHLILEYDVFSGINIQAIFGCVLVFALLLFACTVRGDTSHLGKYGLALSESDEYALYVYFHDQNRKRNKEAIHQNEGINIDDYVGSNYSFFHIILALATMNILMIITNWHAPDEKADLKRLVKNWASVWVQMASSFLCLLLYIWFLVAPLVKRIWGPSFGYVELDPTSIRKKNDDRVTEGKERNAALSSRNTNKQFDYDEKPTSANRMSRLQRRNSNQSVASNYSINSAATMKHKPSRLTRQNPEIVKQKSGEGDQSLDDSIATLASVLTQQRHHRSPRQLAESTLTGDPIGPKKTKGDFHTAPQNPIVAREMLKHQWKILRLQAKVVKIQERIIRLQTEAALTEGVDLPVGQSSLIDGGNWKQMTLGRKENG